MVLLDVVTIRGVFDLGALDGGGALYVIIDNADWKQLGSYWPVY